MQKVSNSIFTQLYFVPFTYTPLICNNNFAGYSRGVQSRSRAVIAYAQIKHDPCPEQLWESQPCEATKCFKFSWHSSAWSRDGLRTVWCERSDGLRVTGKSTTLPE